VSILAAMRNAPSPGILLEDAIRQIVREEVRAALVEAERVRRGTSASVQQHSGLGPPLLSVQEVASKTGLAVQTLNNWRSTGKGPRSFKFGRLVRYNEADVDEWISWHRGAPDNQPEGVQGA
jgi:excisionase family DNA binding protein